MYERRAGEWQQWWLAFARNDQDRGIVRTGRHAGDWELLQVRLDGRGQPVEAETAISFAAPVAFALAAIAVLRRRSSRDAEHREP